MLISKIIVASMLLLYSCGRDSKQNTNTDNNRIVKHQNNIINGQLGNRLDSLLTEQIVLGFSGTVLVSIKDSIVLRKGYGWTDSTNTVPVTPETKFYLASTSKGITGVAITLAQQKELLSVNDHLSKFFPVVPPSYSDITIHQILIHTSGLNNNYETYGYIERDENVAQIFEKDLIYSPNSDFVYSSAGYWLCAAIVDKLSNKTYEQFVYDELFSKANMSNTVFWFEIDDSDKNTFAQKLQRFPPSDLAPNWGFRGSGGVVSNIIDLHKYFNSIFKENLLTPESRAQLLGPHKTLGSGIGIGYGWYQSITARGTNEIWCRGGESFGHNSAIRWFENENVLIIILTNCGVLNNEEIEANRSVSNKIEDLLFHN